MQDLYIWFCQVWQQNLAIPPVAFVFNGAGIESRIAWPTAGLSLTPPLDPGRQMAAGSPRQPHRPGAAHVPKFDLSLMDPIQAIRRLRRLPRRLLRGRGRLA